MNEWTVVTVIVTLLGLLAAVIKPLISLNQTITRLSEVVKELEKDVSGLIEKNDDAHGRLWGRLDGQSGVLSGFETRLALLESSKKVPERFTVPGQ